MHYGLGVIVALILIGAGIHYVRHVEESMQRRARLAIPDAQAEGRIPPDMDAEQVPLRDFGLEVSSSDMHRIRLAQFLSTWRFVLIPLVILSSLGLASLLGKHLSGARKSQHSTPAANEPGR